MNDTAQHLPDEEYDPSVEPKSSKAWLNNITLAEKAFEDWQSRADNLDKLYANLEGLASNTRDRQFQLFWSNIQVLGPSVYSRPPQPVVTPKFKDRRPLYRTASELLERVCVVSFDQNRIDRSMRQVRDDLNIVARGSMWCRYEKKGEGYAIEKACIDYKDRKDFLHEPARYWADVGWVAGAAYLTRKEMRKRFRKHSGEAYADASYAVQKEDKNNSAADNREKARVWEIWSKTEERVVWVTEGVEVLLDEGEPHLTLEGFFPCPEPAYGTLQRRSLVPVPDFLFYKDQIEEINDLTGRIHALSQSLEVRGFYPAGASDLAGAIEAAIKETDKRKVLVPVSNWAAFGNGSAKDTIVWLPIDQVVETIVSCVELRRQLIDDVYQIVGLSDIMRGSTEKEETLGAQQLKAQFGSVRIRDKQNELVRVARDSLAIMAEIIAENFSAKTLLAMSQMDIPTDAHIAQQIEQIEQQAEQQYMQALQQAQQNPNPQKPVDPAQIQQQIVQQVQPQIQKLKETVTIEQVMEFLRNERIRPFVLDIETDSTIQPDEQAEKEARTEFMQVLGSTMQQLGALLEVQPEAAPLAAEILKFATAPFRAGRQLEASIEEFADSMVAKSKQPKPDPEAQKMQAEMQMKGQELQGKAKIEMMKIEADREDRKMEREFKAQEQQAKMAQTQADMQRDQEKAALEIQKLEMEIAAKREELQIKRESAQIDAQAKMQQSEIAVRSAQQKAAIDQQSAQQDAAIKEQQAQQSAEHSEAAFAQKSQLAAQQAALKQNPGGP